MLEAVTITLLVYLAVSHAIFFKVILELIGRALPRDTKEKRLQLIQQAIEEMRKDDKKKNKRRKGKKDATDQGKDDDFVPNAF